MTSANELLQEGITAARAKKADEALALLKQVVQVEPRNEEAWLWLSGVVETDEQRMVCLENVLAINPDHQIAERGLRILRRRAALIKPLPEPAEEPTQPKTAAVPAKRKETTNKKAKRTTRKGPNAKKPPPASVKPKTKTARTAKSTAQKAAQAKNASGSASKRSESSATDTVVERSKRNGRLTTVGQCTHCGGEISESATTCPHCGRPLRTADAGPTTARCPTCNSPHIEKISSSDKAASALLFGIFSIGQISKTFRCRDCGYKW